jgi:hypothetical protein
LPAGIRDIPGRCTAGFFLPTGDIAALEAETLFLMERLKQPYSAIMQMPVGRRRRFCDEIDNIDRTRANKAKKK